MTTKITKELNRVVVTGLGAITPIGNDVKTFWNNLLLGKSGLHYFEETQIPSKVVASVKNYEESKDPNISRFIDFGLSASREAIADSKILNYKNLDKEKVGVSFSSSVGSIEDTINETKNLYSTQETKIKNRSPYKKISARFIPRMLPNMAAGHISIENEFLGGQNCVVTACSSGLDSIINGFNQIQLNNQQVVVSGGTDSCLNELTLSGFARLGALVSSQNLENGTIQYETASTPYHKNRSGFVLGEGSGSIVLESLSHVIERGAQNSIYCEIVGSGNSSDSFHITRSHPHGTGILNAINKALKQQNLDISDICYINSHGTSTPVGDKAEILAFNTLLNQSKINTNKKLLVSSIKGHTGHLLGASPAIEAIATILALKYDRAPFTLNLNHQDLLTLDDNEEIHPNLQFLTQENSKTRTSHPFQYVLSNSSGFGGANAAIIFKKWTGI